VNPVLLQLAGLAALAIAFAGVIVRRRVSECWSFPAYLATVFVCESAVLLWPERYFVWSAYVLRQWTYDVLQFGVAFELARRAFKAFPGARATARPVFVAILIITAISIFAATPAGTQWSKSSFYLTALLTIEPRLLNATIWLFVATSRLVIFFNIPVSNWHRALSLGFAGYLVISVTGLNLLRSFGWDIRGIVSFFDGFAYLALSAWWASAAWQKAESTAVVPASVYRLAAARA
jgi:hypothetical protein